MSRLTATQILIFTSTTLVASLGANIWFFTDQMAMKAEYDQQLQEIQSLSRELAGNKELKSEQIQRLEQMNGQQSELAAIIDDLQSELLTLNQQYLDTVDTADQTRQQLTAAQNKIQTLVQQLADQTRQLEEANITIRNQQRSLKASMSENQPNDTMTQLSTALTSALAEQYNELAVTQTASGDLTLNIPLEYIFKDSFLNFSDDAEPLLQLIANQVKQYPTIDVTVVGHADARPIVSDLAERYPTNWELSSVRASKIVVQLIGLGVNESQLIAAGKASNQPVREEASEEAWSLNRRIEIRFHGIVR
ncbi:MAG: OmpA family protein [Reinekea sp.]|nr:OmpA family protein [Reinekea sp.]